MPDQQLICISASRGIVCGHPATAHAGGTCNRCSIRALAGHGVTLGVECSACGGEGYVNDVRCLFCKGEIWMPLSLAAAA